MKKYEGLIEQEFDGAVYLSCGECEAIELNGVKYYPFTNRNLRKLIYATKDEKGRFSKVANKSLNRRINDKHFPIEERGIVF